MRAIIASALLLSAAPAWAQNTVDMDEVVIVPTIKYDVPADEIIVSGTIETVNYHGSEERIRPGVILLVPSEALNTVPGVQIQQGSGVESLTSIRSPVLTGGAGAGSFAYTLDGISLRAPGFGNVNGFLELPFDLANSLTVYKGPSTARFGGNAQHGAINASSYSDGITDYDSRASVTLGTDEYIAGKAILQNEAVSLGLSAVHDGGFRDDSGYDVQKLLFTAEDDFAAWTLRGVFTATNLNQETAGFAQGVDAYQDNEIAFGNANPEAFRDVKSWLGYVAAFRDFGDDSLWIYAYARQADMDFRLHFLPGQALERNDHRSLGLEGRFDWFRDKVSYGVNVKTEISSGHLDEFQNSPTRFSFLQGNHYDYDVEARRVEFGADFVYEATLKLEINGEARLSNVKYDYENNIDSGVFGRFLRLEDRSDEFTLFSPQIFATYEFNDRLKGFAKVAHSERAPQTTDLYRVQINQADNPADIETLDAVEAGLRGAFGEYGDSIWEVAAYIQRKDNFFFRDADGFNVADGVTDHAGIEVSGRYRINDNWNVSGNAAFAENTYGFSNQVANSSEIITDGNDIDTAPRVTAYGLISYAPQAKPYGASLSVNHVGEYFTNAANSQDYPGHTIVSGGATYELPHEVKLYLRAENLLDTRYANRADFAFGNERYFPGRPRSIFVTLEKRF